MDYTNKYIELGSGIAHVKEVHHQMTSSLSVMEIDDHCGDIYSNIFGHLVLNNKNVLFEFSQGHYFIEVSKQNFEAKLITEVEASANEMACGNDSHMIYFKQTPKRLEIIRKHYVRS